MKTGKTIQELAAEIARQAENKKDFIAPTLKLEMMNVVPTEAGHPDEIKISGLNGAPLGINTHAHAQIAAEANIPRKYYDRMLVDAPDLLAKNVNHWFQAEPKTRLVRTLDGRIRAFLSDRYRPMDYSNLAEAVFPVLANLGVEIISSEITERRLYIKAVDKRILKDIPVGKKLGDASHTFFDTLSPAIVISNSEVGAGALAVETGVWTKLCTNLAVAAQKSMRRYHLGGRHELDNESVTMFSDDTRRKTDAALWAQARDVVKGAFDRAQFDALTNSITEMTTRKITCDPLKAMEVVSIQLGLSDAEQGSVLRHLIEGGDITQYGLFNAVTRTAEDIEDYDRATEFERMGGQVLELSNKEWLDIAMEKAA